MRFRRNRKHKLHLPRWFFEVGKTRLCVIIRSSLSSLCNVRQPVYNPLTEPVSLILVIFKVKPGKKTIYVFSHVKLHWHSQIFNKKYPPSFTSFKSRSLNLYDILIRLCRHCPKAIQWITIRESNSHCQVFKVIVNERLLLHHEISSGIIFFIQQFLCIQLNIYFKFQRFSNLSNIFYIFYPSIIFIKRGKLCEIFTLYL